ncbi:hypothetical protein ACNFU2_06600 [Chryseobacterium sp. PTM-20240506]|uniref:hypothetical protein n=1 Tax=Chryseobacterium sp. PTM-20240506 TaxID=3400631 RepID=UPI003AAA74FB
MKNNGKYSIEETPMGKLITFEKGCIIDFELLHKEIIGMSFIQDNSVDLIKAKPIHYNQNDIVKISSDITVEIKKTK